MDGINSSSAYTIAYDLADDYIKGEIDSIELVTTRYKNMMTYTAENWQLLPVVADSERIKEFRNKELDKELKIKHQESHIEPLSEFLPNLKVRVVNVIDLMRLVSKSAHPHGLTDAEYDAIFTKNKPIIFAFHGYPNVIHELTYKRHNQNMHVRGYIEEVKSAVPDAVIILEDMKSGSNERIHTQGGVNLDIQIGDHVYIDYVGPGFDCRELCTGKAAHETWNIPWNEVPFLKDSAITKYKTSEISQEEYVETAKERILFLIKAFPDRKEEILQTMPKRYNGISRQIFRDVREQVIFPLWLQHEQLLRDGLGSFGVEVNVVEDGTLVPMEIEVPDRFKNKDKNNQER